MRCRAAEVDFSPGQNHELHWPPAGHPQCQSVFPRHPHAARRSQLRRDGQIATTRSEMGTLEGGFLASVWLPAWPVAAYRLARPDRNPPARRPRVMLVGGILSAAAQSCNQFGSGPLPKYCQTLTKLLPICYQSVTKLKLCLGSVWYNRVERTARGRPTAETRILIVDIAPLRHGRRARALCCPRAWVALDGVGTYACGHSPVG